MEISAQTTVMLVLLGIASWAAMFTVVIIFTQPASMERAKFWSEPARPAAASIAFGLMAILTTSLPKFL